MLYLTLLTPFVALPALMLMDRVERWAAGDHPEAFRVARTTATVHVTDTVGGAAGSPWGRPGRGRHRPTPGGRVRAGTPREARPRATS
jgi:hypothetical protein